MSNDNLDTIPNCELSVAFAKEVAGWTAEALAREVPTFSIFADEVMPFLREWVWRAGGEVGEDESSICVTKVNGRIPHDPKLFYHGRGPFARAVCIALIRAKRAEKEASRV